MLIIFALLGMINTYFAMEMIKKECYLVATLNIFGAVLAYHWFIRLI